MENIKTIVKSIVKDNAYQNRYLVRIEVNGLKSTTYPYTKEMIKEAFALDDSEFDLMLLCTNSEN